MKQDFVTIDVTREGENDASLIERVESDAQRLSEAEHHQASRSFLLSDAIASGLAQDLAFVDEIPSLIEQIIDHKLWECLYVAKGVVTPYYCFYNQKGDGENFRDFIVTPRPNGLGTRVETLDRVLQINLPVQRKFRAILKGAGIETFPTEGSSPESIREISESARRAAVAIPIVQELLERELIADAVAACLGQELQNPERLTAEEREYVDRRDLIGLRLAQYVSCHPFPEDEDTEPVYRRQINQYVEDLLAVKERSRSIRVNHPQKAAQKLLQFYQGDELQQLIDYLQQEVTPYPFPKEEEQEAEIPTEPIYLTITELAERLDYAPSTLRNLSSKQSEDFEDWTRQRDPNGFGWQRTDKKRGHAFLYVSLE